MSVTAEPVGNGGQRRPMSHRMKLVLLSASLTFIAGLAREGMEVAILPLRDSLALDTAALDIAHGAFPLGFWLALPFGGALTLVWGVRESLFRLGLGLAIASFLTGLVGHILFLTVLRLILGLCAGALIPVITLAVAPVTPPQERGFALGLALSGLWLGGFCAEFLNVIADALGSWRGLFVLSGFMGFAWAGAFAMLWPPPLLEDAEPVPTLPPIYWAGALYRMRRVAFLLFVTGIGVDLCRFWLPAHLLAFWHVDFRFSDLAAPTLALSITAGCILGGLATDRVLIASGNIKAARQLVPGLGYLIALVALMLVQEGTDDGPITVATAFALFGLQLTFVPLWLIAVDIGRDRAPVSLGLVAGGASLAALLAPSRIVALTGFWLFAWVLALSLITASIFIAFGVRPDHELPDPPPPPPPPVEEEAPAAKKKPSKK